MRMYYKEASELPKEMEMQALRQRILKRVRRNHLMRAVKIGLASAATLILAFAAGVNISPAFAEAVSKLPVLGTLAEAVQWNKGLVDAVQNDYAIPVNQTVQTAHMKLTCTDILTDSEQLVLFLKAEDVEANSKDHDYSMALDQIIDTDSGETLLSNLGIIGEVAVDGSTWAIALEMERETAKHVEVGFQFHDKTEGTTENVKFSLDLSQPPEPITYDLEETILVEDQQLTIQRVTLYPTRAYVDVELDQSNTKQLLNLELYFENQYGERWDSTTIGRYCIEEDEQHYRYCVDSSYFSSSEGLKLVVERVDYLSPEREKIYFNTRTNEFYDVYGELPELQRVVVGTYLGGSLCCTLDARTSGNNTVPFDQYLGSDGEWHSCGLAITGTDEQPIYMITEFEKDSDGVITLKRVYPDVIGYPQKQIELK